MYILVEAGGIDLVNEWYYRKKNVVEFPAATIVAEVRVELKWMNEGCCLDRKCCFCLEGRESR